MIFYVSSHPELDGLRFDSEEAGAIATADAANWTEWTIVGRHGSVVELCSADGEVFRLKECTDIQESYDDLYFELG